MKSTFYKKNRDNYYKNLPVASLFVICSGGHVHRTADDEYRFFANRSFVYFTGIDQPGCYLMAWRLNKEINEVLFVRDEDPAAEIRGGKRIAKEKAKEVSGIKHVMYMSEFSNMFHKLARDIYFDKLYLCLESNIGQELTDKNYDFMRFVNKNYPGLIICNAFPEISTQRSIKSEEEIENMRKAIDITHKGIVRMMQCAKKAKTEMDLFAEFMYVIHKHGYVEPAFKPIVSSGKNNFYLHYDTPKGVLVEGDICLSDVGAMVDYCCVDISRVFPQNGNFSQRQKDVYNISLDVNDAITDEIKPGMTFSDIDRRYKEKVFHRLKSLGLLNDKKDLCKYVWHGLSHHVGFDVHDVGSYQSIIAENMVFTMDTGIYIREWGIGLRIEDNVLVTKKGLVCLSKEIPRTIEDIENIMS